MAQLTLAILTDPTDAFWRWRYLVKQLIRHWESMGFRIVVVTDESDFVPADIALLHTDLSLVPDRCRRLAERYPVVLNGRVLDICKRQWSHNLVERDSLTRGPVIVKTNWNSGGNREFRRMLLESFVGPVLRLIDPLDILSKLLCRVEARRSWRYRRVLQAALIPCTKGLSRFPRAYGTTRISSLSGLSPSGTAPTTAAGNGSFWVTVR